MYNSHIIHSSHLRHNLPFSNFNRSINLHSRGCLLTNIILIPCRHIRRMFICFHVSVPLTEARRQRLALEDAETRRTSSRGLIPRAKVKTIKMTFVIIFGEWTTTKHRHLLSFHHKESIKSGILPSKNLFWVFLVSVFVLCWSPYIVFDLLQVRLGRLSHEKWLLEYLLPKKSGEILINLGVWTHSPLWDNHRRGDLHPEHGPAQLSG